MHDNNNIKIHFWIFLASFLIGLITESTLSGVLLFMYWEKIFEERKK